MAKIKRFANVSSPRSNVVHRLYAKRLVEGELTACGIAVQKGWPFWYRGRWPKWGDLLGRRCKRCERVNA